MQEKLIRQAVLLDEALEGARGNHCYFTFANCLNMGEPYATVLHRHLSQHLPGPPEGEQPVLAVEVPANHFHNALYQRKYV